ncbi:MAG: hypothetical protein N3A58_07235 [Spirochaetes bacterium]|nr:hypothetical protein [Spirochaetota bacterium]
MLIYSFILWILAIVIKIFAIVFAGGFNSVMLFYDPLSIIFDFGITILIILTFIRPAKLIEYIRITIKEKSIEKNILLDDSNYYFECCFLPFYIN